MSAHRLCAAGIAIIAYSSLGSSSNKASVGSGVAQVAARHGVSSAALLLRWALARGAVVILGATSAAHIRENLAARRLRFELSPPDAPRQPSICAFAHCNLRRWLV